MGVFEQIMFNGLFYTIISSGYLLLFMISFNPRIWGYQDYPKKIKEKIPPQTRRERLIAGIVSIPWFFFILTYPIFSTTSMKTELGGEIPLEVAFLNIFFMVSMFFLLGLCTDILLKNSEHTARCIARSLLSAFAENHGHVRG